MERGGGCESLWEGIYHSLATADYSVPGAGSFIRPTAKGLSRGRSFVAAIKDRYLDDSAGPDQPQPDSFAPTRDRTSPDHPSNSTLYHTNFNREIEVPSLDKISALFRQLDRLTAAGLEFAEVASAGDQAELAALGVQMARTSTSSVVVDHIGIRSIRLANTGTLAVQDFGL